jgi:hypothetical protein
LCQNRVFRGHSLYPQGCFVHIFWRRD